jgi:HEAT repeat protein
MRRHTSGLFLLGGPVIFLALAARGLGAQPEEDKLLAVLHSSAPTAEKARACFELKTVGTPRSVASLAALLTDPQLSHPARDALTTMPYPEAAAALRDALPRAQGTIRIGIIACIGTRRDQAATRLLAPLLADPVAQVRAAAAAALGDIATAESAHTLLDGLNRTDSKSRAALGDGCLRCARHLATAGKLQDASALFARLTQADQDRSVRRAAQLGLLQGAGHEMGVGHGELTKTSVIVGFLNSQDPDTRVIAASQLKSLPDAEFRSLAGNLSKVSSMGQEAVLAAAVLRDDRTLLPMIIEAARSRDSAARPAALKSLGRLGDQSVLPYLLEGLFADPATHDGARRSLEMLRGPHVDELLIAAMQKEQAPDRKAELIDILGGRGAGAAVPVLLDQATGETAALRMRAMSALALVAQPRDVPGLMRGLYKSARGPERDNAEKAILAVCETIPAADRRADPILAALRTADDSQKATALPLLGRTGAPAALQSIQTALASKKPEVYAAGVRALANWPKPEIADQLLGLAQGTANTEHRSVALVGLARVVTSAGAMPPPRCLEFLKQAMALADRDDDRRVVLERAALVHTLDTLRFARPYLDQPNLCEQACRTVVALAHQRSLRLPNRNEFDRALERVIQQSKQAGVVDEAKKYLAGL